MGDKNNVSGGRKLWNRDIVYDAKNRMLLAKEQDIDGKAQHNTNIAVIGKTRILIFEHEGINSVYESLVYRTNTVEYGLFVFKDEASLRLYWENIRGLGEWR